MQGENKTESNLSIMNKKQEEKAFHTFHNELRMIDEQFGRKPYVVAKLIAAERKERMNNSQHWRGKVFTL